MGDDTLKPPLPVIIVTVDGRVETRETALAAGANDFGAATRPC